MPDINSVTNTIKSCKTLSEIPDKDFLDFETGHAYIVAKESKNLKTTQLRKFFGALKKMEQKDTWAEIETDFYLLKPRMAVASGRGNVPKPFLNVVMAAMSKVDNVESDEEKMVNFDKFVKFFEAIVAYHKYLYPKSR
jgi:CRISPR-associated protein Csm2